VSRTVVVEVVVEFVGDAGELFEEIVEVLLTTRFAWADGQGLDGFSADVEQLDEDEDTIVGDVGGVAQLFYLSIGHRIALALGVHRQREEHKEKREAEATEHRVQRPDFRLMGEDLVE